MTNLEGLGTALITPFLPDGRVDEVALERLVEQQIAAGVDYLVVLGTTAEAATLTPQEKQQVQELIIRRVNKRVPLVLGIGGNNTAEVVRQVQALDETQRAAFSAILSVCPYYNKPSQEGLFRHFCAIAEASPLPLILYNVPGRTGVNMLPETVMRIVQAQPNKIMGIKEASGKVEQIKELIRLRDEQQAKLLVISGDDGLAVELLQAGADGLISVASNAYASDFVTLVHTADPALQERYNILIKLLFVENNPAGIKAVLALQGLIHNILRLPLVPLSSTTQEAIEGEYRRLKN